MVEQKRIEPHVSVWEKTTRKDNPNPRGRETPKRGRKPLFEPWSFEERLSTIERVFAGRRNSVACCFALIASVTCTMHLRPLLTR